jgi:hypothetical protein
MVVQQMLEYLRDTFDKFTATVVAGTATVPAAGVVVTVAASLPVNCAVVIAPEADPGAGMRYWIASKNTAGFNIALSAAAPGGGLKFSWIAKGV